MQSAFNGLVILLLMAALSGCSHFSSAPENSNTTSSGYSPLSQNLPNHAWHALRFRMPRAEDGSSNWDMDLLLANEVIRPALASQANDIPLWRFHRRSGADAAGHQFSFIFYAETKTAEALFGQVQNSILLPQLVDTGLLITTLYQTDAYKNPTELAATSDKNWAPVIQRQWPQFIMGASATWLGLISELVPPADNSSEKDETPVEQLLARYGHANTELTQLWQEQGQHAYLHHLSAIFGYQPLNFKARMAF